MSEKKAKAARKAATGQNAKGRGDVKENDSKMIIGVSIMCCVFLALIIILVVRNRDNPDENTFPYSEGIAENGFWEDTAALDYVELFDYLSFQIPKEIHEISDSDLQAEITSRVESYTPETKQITDRPVADGDKVNIDYIGSVDGVEFEGGSTGGEGTEETAGSANYIDDFLTQIIGHNPGETFNVEVTFPEDYGQENLNGKDAVFVTTINYIAEYDISDGFVEENLYDEYGWKTLDEMEEGIREELQERAVGNYISDYLANDVTIYSIPENIATYQEKFIEYQGKEMLDNYQGYADSNEMELDVFLQSYMGLADKDALLEQIRNGIMNDVKRSLAVQAIAEDAGISVGDEDMDNYLPGYAMYKDQYGMPWLKQYVLGQKTIDYIIENAVFLP